MIARKAASRYARPPSQRGIFDADTTTCAPMPASAMLANHRIFSLPSSPRNRTRAMSSAPHTFFPAKLRAAGRRRLDDLVFELFGFDDFLDARERAPDRPASGLGVDDHAHRSVRRRHALGY